MMLSNPIREFVLKPGIKEMIPKNLEKGMKGFNAALGSIFPNLINKINYRAANPDYSGNWGFFDPMNILAGLFSVDTGEKKKYDPSRYERGAVAWDGIAHRTLVNVIPGYLQRIEAALTHQDEIMYDYDRGQWVYANTTQESIEKSRMNTRQYNLYNLIQAAQPQRAKEMNALPEEQRAAFEKAMTEFFSFFADMKGNLYLDAGRPDKLREEFRNRSMSLTSQQREQYQTLLNQNDAFYSALTRIMSSDKVKPKLLAAPKELQEAEAREGDRIRRLESHGENLEARILGENALIGQRERVNAMFDRLNAQDQSESAVNNTLIQTMMDLHTSDEFYQDNVIQMLSNLHSEVAYWRENYGESGLYVNVLNPIGSADMTESALSEEEVKKALINLAGSTSKKRTVDTRTHIFGTADPNNPKETEKQSIKRTVISLVNELLRNGKISQADAKSIIGGNIAAEERLNRLLKYASSKIELTEHDYDNIEPWVTDEAVKKATTLTSSRHKRPVKSGPAPIVQPRVIKPAQIAPHIIPTGSIIVAGDEDLVEQGKQGQEDQQQPTIVSPLIQQLSEVRSATKTKIVDRIVPEGPKYEHFKSPKISGNGVYTGGQISFIGKSNEQIAKDNDYASKKNKDLDEADKQRIWDMILQGQYNDLASFNVDNPKEAEYLMKIAGMTLNPNAQQALHDLYYQDVKNPGEFAETQIKKVQSFAQDQFWDAHIRTLDRLKEAVKIAREQNKSTKDALEEESILSQILSGTGLKQLGTDIGLKDLGDKVGDVLFATDNWMYNIFFKKKFDAEGKPYRGFIDYLYGSTKEILIDFKDTIIEKVINPIRDYLGLGGDFKDRFKSQLMATGGTLLDRFIQGNRNAWVNPLEDYIMSTESGRDFMMKWMPREVSGSVARMTQEQFDTLNANQQEQWRQQLLDATRDDYTDVKFKGTIDEYKERLKNLYGITEENLANYTELQQAGMDVEKQHQALKQLELQRLKEQRQMDAAKISKKFGFTGGIDKRVDILLQSGVSQDEINDILARNQDNEVALFDALNKKYLQQQLLAHKLIGTDDASNTAYQTDEEALRGNARLYDERQARDAEIAVRYDEYVKGLAEGQEAMSADDFEKQNRTILQVPKQAARGSQGKAYTGLTTLHAGEGLFNKYGAGMVKKTGVYQVDEPTMITNTEDTYDILKYAGLPTPEKRVSVSQAQRDEDAVADQYQKSLDTHAQGAGSKDIWRTIRGNKPFQMRDVFQRGLTEDELSAGYDTLKKYVPEALAGAAIGGTTSLAFGLVGGPLVGAAVGAGAMLLSKSQVLQDALFGKIGEDGKRAGGIISQGVQDTIKKYVPTMADYGMAGILASLFLPFGPVAGMLIGSGIGFLKTNETVREQLFGKLGIGDKEKAIIKKTVPNMLKGAGVAVGATLFGLGPFGLLGNMAIGAGIGMLTTSDEFMDSLLGPKDKDGKRTGGLVGVITNAFEPLKNAGAEFKDRIFNAIDKNLLKPLRDFIKPTIHAIPQLLGWMSKKIDKFMTKNFGVGLHNIVDTYIAKPIKTAFMPLAKLGGGIFNLVTSPMRLVGAAGRAIQRRQLSTMNSEYMGDAAERLRKRTDDLGMDVTSNEADRSRNSAGKKLSQDVLIDQLLASSDKATLEKLRGYVSTMSEDRKLLEKDKTRKNQEVMTMLDSYRTTRGFRIDPGTKMEIATAINSGRAQDIAEILKNRKLENAGRGMSDREIEDLMKNVGLQAAIGKYQSAAEKVKWAENGDYQSMSKNRLNLQERLNKEAQDNPYMKAMLDILQSEDRDSISKLDALFGREIESREQKEAESDTEAQQLDLTGNIDRNVMSIVEILEQVEQDFKEFMEGNYETSQKNDTRREQAATYETDRVVGYLQRRRKTNEGLLGQEVVDQLPEEELESLGATRGYGLMRQGLRSVYNHTRIGRALDRSIDRTGEYLTDLGANPNFDEKVLNENGDIRVQNIPRAMMRPITKTVGLVSGMHGTQMQWSRLPKKVQEIATLLHIKQDDVSIKDAMPLLSWFKQYAKKYKIDGEAIRYFADTTPTAKRSIMKGLSDKTIGQVIAGQRVTKEDMQILENPNSYRLIKHRSQLILQKDRRANYNSIRDIYYMDPIELNVPAKPPVDTTVTEPTEEQPTPPIPTNARGTVHIDHNFLGTIWNMIKGVGGAIGDFFSSGDEQAKGKVAKPSTGTLGSILGGSSNTQAGATSLANTEIDKEGDSKTPVVTQFGIKNLTTGSDGEYEDANDATTRATIKREQEAKAKEEQIQSEQRSTWAAIRSAFGEGAAATAQSVKNNKLGWLGGLLLGGALWKDGIIQKLFNDVVKPVWDNAISPIVTKIGNWFMSTALPAMGEFVTGKVLPGIGEALIGFGTWFGENLPSMIGGTFKGLYNFGVGLYKGMSNWWNKETGTEMTVEQEIDEDKPDELSGVTDANGRRLTNKEAATLRSQADESGKVQLYKNGQQGYIKDGKLTFDTGNTENGEFNAAVANAGVKILTDPEKALEVSKFAKFIYSVIRYAITHIPLFGKLFGGLFKVGEKGAELFLRSLEGILTKILNKIVPECIKRASNSILATASKFIADWGPIVGQVLDVIYSIYGADKAEAMLGVSNATTFETLLCAVINWACEKSVLLPLYPNAAGKIAQAIIEALPEEYSKDNKRRQQYFKKEYEAYKKYGATGSTTLGEYEWAIKEKSTIGSTLFYFSDNIRENWGDFDPTVFLHAIAWKYTADIKSDEEFLNRYYEFTNPNNAQRLFKLVRRGNMFATEVFIRLCLIFGADIMTGKPINKTDATFLCEYYNEHVRDTYDQLTDPTDVANLDNSRIKLDNDRSTFQSLLSSPEIIRTERGSEYTVDNGRYRLNDNNDRHLNREDVKTSWVYTALVPDRDFIADTTDPIEFTNEFKYLINHPEKSVLGYKFEKLYRTALLAHKNLLTGNGVTPEDIQAFKQLYYSYVLGNTDSTGMAPENVMAILGKYIKEKYEEPERGLFGFSDYTSDDIIELIKDHLERTNSRALKPQEIFNRIQTEFAIAHPDLSQMDFETLARSFNALRIQSEIGNEGQGTTSRRVSMLPVPAKYGMGTTPTPVTDEKPASPVINADPGNPPTHQDEGYKPAPNLGFVPNVVNPDNPTDSTADIVTSQAVINVKDATVVGDKDKDKKDKKKEDEDVNSILGEMFSPLNKIMGHASEKIKEKMAALNKPFNDAIDAILKKEKEDREKADRAKAEADAKAKQLEDEKKIRNAKIEELIKTGNDPDDPAILGYMTQDQRAAYNLAVDRRKQEEVNRLTEENRRKLYESYKQKIELHERGGDQLSPDQLSSYRAYINQYEERQRAATLIDSQQAAETAYSTQNDGTGKYGRGAVPSIPPLSTLPAMQPKDSDRDLSFDDVKNEFNRIEELRRTNKANKVDELRAQKLSYLMALHRSENQKEIEHLNMLIDNLHQQISSIRSMDPATLVTPLPDRQVETPLTSPEEKPLPQVNADPGKPDEVTTPTGDKQQRQQTKLYAGRYIKLADHIFFDGFSDRTVVSTQPDFGGALSPALIKDSEATALVEEIKKLHDEQNIDYNDIAFTPRITHQGEYQQQIHAIAKPTTSTEEQPVQSDQPKPEGLKFEDSIVGRALSLGKSAISRVSSAFDVFREGLPEGATPDNQGLQSVTEVQRDRREPEAWYNFLTNLFKRRNETEEAIPIQPDRPRSPLTPEDFHEETYQKLLQGHNEGKLNAVDENEFQVLQYLRDSILASTEQERKDALEKARKLDDEIYVSGKMPARPWLPEKHHTAFSEVRPDKIVENIVPDNHRDFIPASSPIPEKSVATPNPNTPRAPSTPPEERSIVIAENPVTTQPHKEEVTTTQPVKSSEPITQQLAEEERTTARIGGTENLVVDDTQQPEAPRIEQVRTEDSSELSNQPLVADHGTQEQPITEKSIYKTVVNALMHAFTGDKDAKPKKQDGLIDRFVSAFDKYFSKKDEKKEESTQSSSTEGSTTTTTTTTSVTGGTPSVVTAPSHVVSSSTVGSNTSIPTGQPVQVPQQASTEIQTPPAIDQALNNPTLPQDQSNIPPKVADTSLPPVKQPVKQSTETTGKDTTVTTTPTEPVKGAVPPVKPISLPTEDKKTESVTPTKAATPIPPVMMRQPTDTNTDKIPAGLSIPDQTALIMESGYYRNMYGENYPIKYVLAEDGKYHVMTPDELKSVRQTADFMMNGPSIVDLTQGKAQPLAPVQVRPRSFFLSRFNPNSTIPLPEEVVKSEEKQEQSTTTTEPRLPEGSVPTSPKDQPIQPIEASKQPTPKPQLSLNSNTTDEEIENYLTKVREWCKENGSEIAETEIDKIRTNAINQRDALKPKVPVQPQVPAIPQAQEKPVVQPITSTQQQSDRLITWGQPIENAVRSSLSIEDYNEDEFKTLMAKQDKTLAEQQKMSLMLSLRRAYYERDPYVRNVLLATARRQDMMYQSANRKNGIKPISTTPTIPTVGQGKFGRGFSKQNDPAIANMRFNVNGDTEYQTLGDSACGPTAAVNVMESLYGRGKEDVVNASQYALSKGYKERNGGTNPAFFRDYFSKNGIESDTTTDRAHMKHQIESGKPTILMGKDAQGTSSKTPYGKAPHYVTVTGMDRYGRAIVQDPEVKRDNLLYDVDDLVNKSSIGISAGRGKYAPSKTKFGLGKLKQVLFGKGPEDEEIDFDSEFDKLTPELSTGEVDVTDLASYGASTVAKYGTKTLEVVARMLRSLANFIDAVFSSTVVVDTIAIIAKWLGKANPAVLATNLCETVKNYLVTFIKNRALDIRLNKSFIQSLLKFEPIMRIVLTIKDALVALDQAEAITGIQNPGPIDHLIALIAKLVVGQFYNGILDIFIGIPTIVQCIYKAFAKIFDYKEYKRKYVETEQAYLKWKQIPGNEDKSKSDYLIEEFSLWGYVSKGASSIWSSIKRLFGVDDSSQSIVSSESSKINDMIDLPDTQIPEVPEKPSGGDVQYQPDKGMGKSTVSKYGRGMDERALQIRNYLMSKGVQENATYGILGNMQHESAMNPERMENLLAQEMRDSGKFPFINWPRNIYNETERYGHEYTEAINSGRISREEFLRPSVGKAAGKDKRGYGLVQFTSAGLKNQLYDATVSKGKSIGSLTDQLDSIINVINSNSGYKAVKEAMYNPSITPDTMADIFVRKYERPANVDATTVDRIKSARQWQAKLSTNKNNAMPPEGESIPPQNGQTENTVEGAVTAGSANDTANNPVSASPGGALETILSKISEAFEAGFNKLLGIEPAPPAQSIDGSTVPGQVPSNTVPPTTENPGETPPGVAPVDVQGTGIITRPEDMTESPSKINSPFGYRIHPIKKVRKLHTGVDLLLYKLDRPKRFGHPVKIAADGVVSRVQNIKTGYGNNVIVDHGGGYQTLYAHLNDTAGISKGMKVKAGAPILHEGSSGGSTGPHLHFEVRKNQTPINPQTGLYEIAKMFQTSGPRDNNTPLTPTTNANMTSDQANLEQAMTPPADQTNPTQSSTGKGTSEPKITPEHGTIESKYGRGGFGQQLFSQVGIPFMQKLFGEMNKPKPASQIPQAQSTTSTQTPRAAIPQNAGQTPPIVQSTTPATSDKQPTGDKEKEKNPLQNFSSLFNMTNIGSIASGLLTDRDRTISSVKDMVGNALTKDVQEGIKTSDKIDKPSGDFLSSVVGDLAPKAIKGQDISTRDVFGSTNKDLQGLLRDSGVPTGAGQMLSSVIGAMTGDGGNPMVDTMDGFLDLLTSSGNKPTPQPTQPGQTPTAPTITTPTTGQPVTPTQPQSMGQKQTIENTFVQTPQPQKSGGFFSQLVPALAGKMGPMGPLAGMMSGFLDGLIEDKSSKPQPTPTEMVQNNAELGKSATQQPQATQPMQPGQTPTAPTTTTPEGQQTSQQQPTLQTTQPQQTPTTTQPNTTEQPAQQPMQPQLPQAQPVTKPQEPQQIVIKPAPVDTRTVSPDYSKTLESIAQAAMRTAQNTDQLQLLVKLLQEKGVINVSDNDIANVQQGNSNAEKLATQFGKGKMKGNDKLAAAARKAQSRHGTGTVDASQLDTYANTVNNQGNNAIITMMQTLASE